MKLAAVILVAVGSVGLIASYVLMRRRLDHLRRIRQERE